jgi:hypothetical protein
MNKSSKNALPPQKGELVASMRYLPLLGETDQGEGFASLKSVYQQVVKLDALIYEYGRALELVQPPAPGKISIRFLRRQWGAGDSRHPHFVQWFRSGSTKRWLYQRIKPADVLRKLKSYSAFQTTREKAHQLLKTTRDLVELREKLMSDLGKMRRTLAMHTAKAAKAAEPYRAQIEPLIAALQIERSEIIERVREIKQLAADNTPQGVVLSTATMPKTHRRAGTRGRKD